MVEHKILDNEDFEFRLLFEFIPNGVVVVDDKGFICLANAEAEKLLGYSRNELIGQPVEILVPKRFHSEHIAMRRTFFDTSQKARAMGGGRALIAQTRGGGEIPVAIGLRPLQFRGRSVVLASIVDITERTTIMRELAHRSKNLLAIVMSVAHQTIRESTDMAAFKKSFEGRLEAMAQSMELLIDQKWLGISIVNLVQTQMKPFAGAGDRIISAGPSIMLRPEFAQRLGLALHELATNAVKYGALSAPKGKVTIRWKFDDAGDRRLKMTWAEQDGPKVAPPVRTGFGHKLLNSLKQAGLCDDMKLDFRADGLRWYIECSELQVVSIPDPAESVQKSDGNGANSAVAANRVDAGDVKARTIRATPGFEIPADLRTMAERSLEQVNNSIQVYLRLIQRGVMSNRISSSNFSSNVFDFAKFHVASAFDLSVKLMKVTDPRELIALQSEFVQTQMQAIGEQLHGLKRKPEGR